MPSRITRSGVLLVVAMLAATSAACVDEGDPGTGAETAGTGTAPASGQTPLTTIHEDLAPRCGQCRIQLRDAGSFGALDDPVLLRDIPIVDRDREGRLYAAVYKATDHELIQYQPTGEVLGTVGGHGRGPGEFTSVWDIHVGPDDSLLVGHEDRVTVFDAARAYIRTFRLESGAAFGRRIVGFSDGRLLTTESRASNSPVPPIHAYDERGQYIGGFGPPDFLEVLHHQQATGPGARLVSAMRHAVWDRDGGVWLAGGSGGYRLERVSLEGEVDRVIGVRSPPEWNMAELAMTAEEAADLLDPKTGPRARSAPHQPRERRAQRRAFVRPRGVLKDVGLLEGDLLVAILHVPSEAWERAVVPVDTTRTPPVSAPGFHQQLYDTVIDVLDVRTGAVVARHRAVGTLYLTTDGALYRPSVEPTGVIHVDVYEIDLYRPGG